MIWYLAPRLCILLMWIAIAVGAMIHFYREGKRHGWEDCHEAWVWKTKGESDES